MIRFHNEQILKLYQLMVEKTGGSVGIREESLLASAVEAPYQTFDGVELFPSLLEKAARLGYGLVANHPFIDGNKRIGIFVMLVFLEVNGMSLNFTDHEVVDMALGVASGNLKYNDILKIKDRYTNSVKLGLGPHFGKPHRM